MENPIPGGAGRKAKPINEVLNGSMVHDFHDMQQLGADMEAMKTNTELLKEGLVPDPIQD
ncbi:hypothetical protein [Paenibacillus albus]|uniref:Uncharacterized protein n=1 Tax=Paenibacillus albus TaxID=2495582 RepID=A0A3S9A2K9_9BACL|nr:hypothetical protein [Paenibacillus albus]AZN40017.1 hypothetical protein EJC50_10385 [Paenibacillus albus]